MPDKRSNQKLKILYLMKILMEKTDEKNGITMQDILQNLLNYGIEAERKSIYNDIALLNDYGMDIISEQKNNTKYYYLLNRSFELAELKLLVDSVQSSRFITKKKSDELIGKIASLASENEALQLKRQVYVTNRVKSDNETILYNVDSIHKAIADNVKITFRYFNWTVEKTRELRHGGALYSVSPWMLSWDNENYYLVAWDDKDEVIKHFRVDKMLDINVTETKRDGKDVFEKLDKASYTEKIFGMFAAKEETVRLLCENRFAGIMIDRFGKDIIMIRTDDNHFTVNINVAVSSQFLAWVISLGAGIKITGPEDVLDKVRLEIKRLDECYNGSIFPY